MQEAQAQKEDTQKIFTESYLIKNQLQQTLNATLTQVEQHNSDQPIEIIKKSIDKFTQENKQLVEHIQSEESQEAQLKLQIEQQREVLSQKEAELEQIMQQVKVQEDKLKTYQSQSQQKEAFYLAQKRDIMILQEQLMCLQQKPRLYLLIYPKNSNKNAFNYENFCKYSKKNKDITVLPNDKITSSESQSLVPPSTESKKKGNYLFQSNKFKFTTIIDN